MLTLFVIVYLKGFNENGQCGFGHEMQVTSPSKVEFEDTGVDRHVVAISCGDSNTGEPTLYVLVSWPH